MTWISKYWKWIVVGLAILLIAYGVWARPDRKITNMLIAEYKKEIGQIVQTLEKDNADLQKREAELQKQVLQLQKDKAILSGKIKERDGRINELEAKIAGIVVPADLDALITDLRNRGYKGATRSPNPNRK